ncbi:MAG: site-specific DNA-methyltransferase [Candidatus Cloacimonetes bacterium]|nr:site-specific DNA-methyltransferase [Actinomycetota bacterium]MBL7087146.1 site-specific DNA-methyltransferase [Candidatus Cloacimonadota bacterium]
MKIIHKVYHGDCFTSLLYVKNKSVDLIITDPPYGQNYSTGRKKNVVRKTTEIKYDKGDLDIERLIKELYRVSKKDCHIYIFTSWKTVDNWKPIVEKYFVLKNILIWSKDNHTAGDLAWSYAQSYEMILFAMKGRKKIKGPRERDCFFIDKIKGNKQIHLLQKPEKLLKYFIEKSSVTGDVVLDPFAGSGSTGAVCMLTNRSSIQIEIEKKYIKNIIKRLENTNLFTKKQKIDLIGKVANNE